MASRQGEGIACTVTLPLYLLSYSLFLTSYAMPFWVKSGEEQGGYNYGLWINCTDVTGEQSCGLIDPALTPEWYKVVQGCATVTVIAGVVVGTIYPMLPVNAFFQWIAGIFQIVAVIIFPTLYKRDLQYSGDSLGWCYAIGVVSGVLFLGNAVALTVVSARTGCSCQDVWFTDIRRKKQNE